MSKRSAAGGRRTLFLLMLIFLAAATGVWFTLVYAPGVALKKQQVSRTDALAALEKARKQVEHAARAKAAMETNQHRLDGIEAKIPVGDPYRWLVKAFGEFPGASRVAIANIDAPHVSESTIYPKVPYKAATFSLSGVGFYHEFGAFLAELENEFPHMRVRRLELSPAYPGTADSDEGEKLNFQLDLLVLFKPAAASPTQLSQGPAGTQQN